MIDIALIPSDLYLHVATADYTYLLDALPSRDSGSCYPRRHARFSLHDDLYAASFMSMHSCAVKCDGNCHLGRVTVLAHISESPYGAIFEHYSRSKFQSRTRSDQTGANQSRYQDGTFDLRVSITTNQTAVSFI